MTAFYDELTTALDAARKMGEKLAESHDDLLDERDGLRADLDNLDARAREAGYEDAHEALDVLLYAAENNLRGILDEHHESAGHPGPLRFCSDRLCAAVVAA